jgi:hypothetical protein
MAGSIEVLSVWARAEDRWSLLAITCDPLSLRAACSNIPNLAGALKEGKRGALRPATSLFPTTGLPREYGKGPSTPFSWTPSPSSGVLAEIADFHYRHGSRLFVNPDGKVYPGDLWTTNWPWSWRVWSISRDGRIVTSEIGTFQH